ncbi:MAG: hypothetical protein AAGB46_13625 [Verrucomicrobiota bacterium]
MITIQKSAIGTAPGKLDFLGGFQDGSGGLTLQAQTQAKTTVLATEGSDPILSITSTQRGQFKSEIESFKELLASKPSNSKITEWFTQFEVPIWARYVAACVVLFNREFGWQPNKGLAFAISSDIPIRVGIGSSAALEVATLHALEKLSGQYFTDRRLAEIAIELEREIIGAHDDVLTQLSSAYGKPGCLIPVRSRPEAIATPIELPKGVTIIGFPSEARQDNPRNAHNNKILKAAKIGEEIARDQSDSVWEFATDIQPSRYLKHIKPTLPESLTGHEITEKFPDLSDGFESNKTYLIRDAFSFSIFENHRCSLAAQLLYGMAHNSKRKVTELLGELMYQSHLNYSLLGLTSHRTDEMVDAFAQAGADQGIFGARISGFGSGSAIVALVDKKALKIVRDLLKSFERDTGEVVPLIR